jgi:hypothetical protein
VGLFHALLLATMPLSADLSWWGAHTTWIVAAVLVAAPLLGLRFALAGRPLLPLT